MKRGECATKGKILLAALLVVFTAVLVMSAPAVFAADNETAVVATSTYVFDMGPVIEIALISLSVATVGFVISELYGTYTTKSAQMGIMQTATTGINSIVSMATLSVAAAQGIAVTEISGIPTQITPPASPAPAPTAK